MGLLKGLFGSSPKVDIEPHPVTTEGQQAGLAYGLRALTNQLTAGPPEDFFSAAEGRSLEGLEQLGSGIGQQSESQAATLGAFKDLLSGFQTGEADRQQAFKDAVETPALEFLEKQLGVQRADYAGTGNFFGGQRLQSEGRTIRGVGRDVAAQRLGFNQQGIDNMLNAITAGTELGKAGTAQQAQDVESLISILEAQGIPRQAAEDYILKRMELLLQGSTVPTIENIVLNDPGQAGLIPELLIAGVGGWSQGRGARTP